MFWDMSKIEIDVDISKIPDGWIITHFAAKYGNTIKEPFDGRSIRVRSFWAKDSTPSLFFFYRNGKYLFKCFASDNGGDAVHFVKLLEGSTTYGQTRRIIEDEWKQFKADNHIYHVTPSQKRYVNGMIKGEYAVVKEEWTRKHLSFWSEYKIKEETLFKFNVVPIQSYKYISAQGNSSNFTPDLGFAFMNKKGPFQLYLPGKDPKYITIQPDYYAGLDQLTYKKKTLGILSGLKDIMAFDSYGLDVDCIAGPSESILIKEDMMVHLIEKYDNQFALADYDDVGMRMVQMYYQIYAIKPIIIKLEKDVAENNRRHALEFMKNWTVNAIDKKINQEHADTAIPL